MIKKLAETLYRVSLISILALGKPAFPSTHNHKRSILEPNQYIEQIKWTKANLSYTVIGNVASRNQTSVDTVEKTVREAFDEWERNSCFKFKRIPSDQARESIDIKVVFANDK